MNVSLVMIKVVPILVLLMGLAGGHAPAQGNTATTRTNNPDGSTTVTTTTTYKDGSTTTTTTYDKDGHDAGTTRTDVQTKDGEKTTTTTKYDGSGHETSRTVERADKDGNKTTTTYDGQGHETGKSTIPKEAPKNVQASIQGVVVPDDVHDRQPFSFAVPPDAGQGQVSIQTISGVVVDQRRDRDRYGRVFLSAGLAAGSYLINLGEDNKTKQVGKIDIKPRPGDALDRPWEHPPQQMKIVYPPQSVKVGDPLWLSGHGFSPNCTDMQANLFASGQTHAVPVLAATEDQLKLAPISEIKPGVAELKVTNQATHQSAPSLPLYFYDLQGHLQQNKLKSGQQTTLVLEASPANVKMNVHTTISGKATFSGGRTEMDSVIERGRLTVPVVANKGTGDFNIDYEGQPEEQPRSGKCACGCGGTAQPACAHKGCSCSSAATETSEVPKLENVSKPSKSTGKTTCSCGCGGTAQPACAHKACACSKSAAASDLKLDTKLENVSERPSKPTGRATCSCGCGGTAQPRCAHKACGCGG